MCFEIYLGQLKGIHFERTGRNRNIRKKRRKEENK
jgi:hypothetical protein